jgi:ParB family chromosome partitioning protein
MNFDYIRILDANKQDHLEENRLIIKKVPLSDIICGYFTPRLTIDENHVRKMVKDINKFGLINPVLLHPHPFLKEKFHAIDGEHRIQVYKILKQKEIPAKILAIKDAEARILALHLNQHTEKKVNIFEEAKSVLKLSEIDKLSQKDIAKRLGKRQQWVSERIQIAGNASEALVNGVTAHEVSPSCAREICRLPKPEQEWIIEKVKVENLTFKETRFLTKLLLDNPSYSGEILDKDLLELVSPPSDIFKEPNDANWSHAQYHIGHCPGCGEEYHLSWKLKILKWAKKGV